MDEPVELELPAVAASVGIARRALTELATAHGADGHAVGLCVSEAMSNAIVHGYREGRTGNVRVFGRIDAERTTLSVDVEDDGVGLVPRPDSPGIGLGMPLVASLARRLEVVATDPGCRVTMWFDAVPPDAQAG